MLVKLEQVSTNIAGCIFPAIPKPDNGEHLFGLHTDVNRSMARGETREGSSLIPAESQRFTERSGPLRHFQGPTGLSLGEFQSPSSYIVDSCTPEFTTVSRTNRLTVCLEVLLALCLLTCREPSGQNVQASEPSSGVPAITGSVVDALSGKPVPGIDVSLSVQSVDQNKPLRFENFRTGTDGRFRFSAVTDPKPQQVFGMPLMSALIANVLFRPPRRAGASSNDDDSGFGSPDVSEIAMWATLPAEQRKGIGDRRAGVSEWLSNKAYFPAWASFFGDCRAEWNVTCTAPASFQNVTIRLIPVLDDPAGCGKIPDADSRERCRQLNTFRAAFLHVDSFAQIQQGKENCKSLENTYVSNRCLELLHNYVRPIDPRDPVRPSLIAEYPPIENVMIMKPVAGMVPLRPLLNAVDPFQQTATYVAHYKRDGDLFEFDTAVAIVQLAKTPADRKRILDYDLSWDDEQPKPVHGKETLMGHSLSTLRVSNLYRLAWPSGEQVVELQFSYGNPNHLAPEVVRRGTMSDQMKRELIEAYLQKYPPSTD